VDLERLSSRFTGADLIRRNIYPFFVCCCSCILLLVSLLDVDDCLLIGTASSLDLACFVGDFACFVVGDFTCFAAAVMTDSSTALVDPCFAFACSVATAAACFFCSHLGRIISGHRGQCPIRNLPHPPRFFIDPDQFDLLHTQLPPFLL